MNKNFQVDREMMFYAFRYALGRSTVAPSIVVENIKHNMKSVNDGDIKAYIKEISECTRLGMQMDEEHWVSFKAFLEEKLADRSSKPTPE